MIRREVNNEFWLIAQHDHAQLAGEMARHVGNKLFEPPRARFDSFVSGVAQHDCGWPLHDDRPTINAEGKPIDVFESTPEIGLKVWQASAERALATGDDYAALLVSLHVLSLSVFATTQSNMKHERFDLNNARVRFEVNRFQHKQIEMQEQLRRKLGLPVDAPMRSGLVESTNDAGELLLQFHFRMLQAMDRLSLALCCTTPPADQISPVLIRPGGKSVTLTVHRRDEDGAAHRLTASPWPFGDDRLQVAVPYRPMPAKRFDSDASLQTEYAGIPPRTLEFELSPG